MERAEDIREFRRAKREQKIKENIELVNKELLEFEKALNRYKNDIDDTNLYITLPILIKTNEVKTLLMENGYPSHSKYENNSTRYGGSWANQFTNNFRFNKHGKWVTSSRQQVTNPMTYEEFKNLIEGNKEFHYEIY